MKLQAMQKGAKHVIELDGVRGLAIVLVLVWHFVGCAVPPGTLIWKMTSFTWCGVDVFFVLSGFLIGGITMDKRSSARFFRAFYARRVARIFPLYYGLLSLAVLGLLVFVPVGARFDDYWSPNVPVWSYFLHLQNVFMAESGAWGFSPLQVTWSLAIEEQFYLFFPLVIFFTGTRSLPWVLLGGIFSGILMRVLFFHFHPHPLISTYVLTPCRWDALFEGAFLAWVVRSHRPVLIPLAKRWVRNTIAAILGVSICGLTVSGIGGGTWQAVYVGHTLFALTGMMFISVCIVVPHSAFGVFFRQRWLCYMGAISYGLYLSHVMVQRGVYWIFRGSATPQIHNAFEALIACVGLLLTVGLSAASFHWFERPLLQRVRRLSSY